MDGMTSSQVLLLINKAVKYTLWRIATTDPMQGPTDGDPEFQKDLPERLYSEAEVGTIQAHAESLFVDTHWVGDVVGTFIGNYVGDESQQSIDYVAFDLGSRQ